jgi:AcrR family transcriptional regulator
MPSTATRDASLATRARLVATAEQLYAERGLDRVSLNEITRAAGQRNASAAQYHFGGREGLIAAILEKHQPAIDRERRTLLDQLEARGQLDLRGLVEALVLPVAAKLEDPDGGSHYLRLMAQLIGAPGAPHLRIGSSGVQVGRDRLMRLVTRVAPELPRSVFRMRAQLVSSLLFHALADFAQSSGRAGQQSLFVANLVDSILAVLGAEPSPQVLGARASGGTR